MPEPVLVCRDLRKRFGPRAAVDGVGFEVAAGECYGLLGPNGVGKTTTISMVCGLLRRDGGEVTVAGMPVDERATTARRNIGYVPQEVALYPDLTGRENLAFFGRLYGLKGRALRAKVDRALDIVGLRDRAGERVDTYSGGMKRRLNVGAGLLHDPRLLVLDEPTVGVDPQSRNAIFENVESLRQQGMAIVYTTHYMEEAERLCDRVGIIDAGRLVAEGTRRELVTSIGERDRVEIAATGPLPSFVEACRTIEGVEEATADETRVQVLAREARLIMPRLLEAADKASCEVTSVEIVEPDLEAVFLHLTGRALRD